MKKFIFLPFLLLCVFSAIAQSPQAIPYQAVLRNADGSVIANQAVTITFTIHNNAVGGTTEYQENHNTTSNALGLINLNVGQGTPSVGTFSTINWGSGTKFLQVAMNSGNGNFDLGTQQMLSVPYTMYTESVSVRVSLSGDSLIIGNQVSIVPGVSAANSLYQQGNGVTDIDGNFYPSIIINGKEWMQENLKVTKYNNGNVIPQSYNYSNCINDFVGDTRNYNLDSNNTLYGKLYNWYAVKDTRKICPIGWHVPDENEWIVLQNYLGGESAAGGKMKSSTNWSLPNVGATNESGFSALPGGFYTTNYIPGFSSLGTSGQWWSSTEFDFSGALYFTTDSYSSSLLKGNSSKKYNLNVRCVKGESSPILGCTNPNATNYRSIASQDDGSCQVSAPGNGVTDQDGNFCPTVIINGQEWMKTDLQVTTYRNGDVIHGANTYLSNSYWQNTTSGAMTGSVFNWFAVMDSRGICPTGYHVPSNDEWLFLANSLGGVSEAGRRLKDIDSWSCNVGWGFYGSIPGTYIQSTNTSGFSAIPNEFRCQVTNCNFFEGAGAFWWSSTGNDSGAISVSIGNGGAGVQIGGVSSPKQDGYSVRCLKD
jgi:uncharacterized protein (TIGR02145 family)